MPICPQNEVLNIKILLMVQKSGQPVEVGTLSNHLQSFKNFTEFQKHPNGGGFGFLNHQPVGLKNDVLFC